MWKWWEEEVMYPSVKEHARNNLNIIGAQIFSLPFKNAG